MTRIAPEAAAIGQAVKAAVVAAGLTLAEAAVESDMTVNTFSRRVNGTIPFTWPELVRVADTTGVTVAELATSAERIAERTALARTAASA